MTLQTMEEEICPVCARRAYWGAGCWNQGGPQCLSIALTAHKRRSDFLAAELAQVKAERDERLARQTDWYQQRFNRLRQWVDEEVRPLSAEVATRYYAITANGSPAPHESADWTNTMHALRLQVEQARAERDGAVELLTNMYDIDWYTRRVAFLARIASGEPAPKDGER